VRLAAPVAEDAAIFARWTENAEYMRLVDTDYALPKSAESFVEFEKMHTQNSTTFRLRTIKDNIMIGFVSLHSFEWGNQTAILSIGIGDPAYWGKGYGTDAMKLILRYAFYELNLYRISLDVIDYNPRAIRLYEKAGFQHEGARRGFVYRDGQRHDAILMGILRSEWVALQG
jgi:RimJ/RimL family protein N-acetyltransferase